MARAGRRRLAAVTALVLSAGLLPGGGLLSAVPAHAGPVGQGFDLSAGDLRFILKQIKIAEQHARTASADNPCGTLIGNGPNQIPDTGGQNVELPWGLRTVDGSCNNLQPDKSHFGAADQPFPRRVPGEYRSAEDSVDLDGQGPLMSGQPTTYRHRGDVFDSHPRVVSNLVVDQSKHNPAAVTASGATNLETVGDRQTLNIPNVATDVGLSAPYNSVFTLFGQFFDHGLDLVAKGGGTVYMPLKGDDPLYRSNGHTNFMVLSRSTAQPGADGVFGTADDVEAPNLTTPFVDQNQTYTSHPSHQVFLREYADAEADVAVMRPVATGRLLQGAAGGMATWADVKRQARDLLGIGLRDVDALNVPLLATDPYGRFERGPNGFPLMVLRNGTRVEGNPNAPLSTAGADGQPNTADDAVKTGHAFLDDIAHIAVPTSRAGTPLTADEDLTADDPAVPRPRGTYDDEMLAAHFIAGDGRANENIGLTAVHHVFHSEHNRLAGAAGEVGTIKHVLTNEDPAMVPEWQLAPGVWNGERIFQAARFVTEMEYQHLAFEEFARKMQPMVNMFGENGMGYNTEVNPAIRAEFAHVVYRFGHSMLTETVARRNSRANGGAHTTIPLLKAFLNPPSFFDGGPAGVLSADEAAGAIFRGMSRQVGSELDEFVTEALRNNLLGLPLDLAAINLARGRETGSPRLNAARRLFYAESTNSAVAPYTSWIDFGLSLRNPESLVNFVAAYGKHETITGANTLVDKRAAAVTLVYGANGPDGVPGTTDDATSVPADRDAFLFSTGAWASTSAGATTTGVDDIDLWVGGLAEKPMAFGGMLGSTFNYVFELQMEDLQFGDRFYYLSRTAGLNLLAQLEGNSFAELISRNTDASGMPADVFSRPDLVIHLENQNETGAIVDDLSTEDYDESVLPLVRMPDGTIRYSGGQHAVFNGRDVDVTGPQRFDERIWSSEGDDTIRGNAGEDWMQGGDGVDNLIGGLGDDTMLDMFGDDTLKGGDGDDALSSGQGFGGDLNQGGRGNDFIVGGNDTTESIAGPGDDMVFAGDGEDTVFGDDGNDWIEGGAGPFNLLQGDGGNPFQDDPDGGHDVLDGDGGEQDLDAEGGDDVMLMGPGIQRAEGMLGFDWATHKGDPYPANTDMRFTAALPPSVDALRDRTDLTEALSGWRFDDVLRGDDRGAGVVLDPGTRDVAEATFEGHELTPAGIERIEGLRDVVGVGTTRYDGGNILLGGHGNDTIEGRGGDDIVDGDRWLNVGLDAPTVSTADAATAREEYASMAQLRQAVFAGDIDPGDIHIVRRVELAPAAERGSADTAVFSGPRAEYDCEVSGTVRSPCPTTIPGGAPTTVTHARGNGQDGTDRLVNVEQLRFAGTATAAPATPTGVSAAAGNGSATVTFDLQPTPAATGVRIRVFDGATPVRTDSVTGDDLTSATVGNLVNGRSYTFAVAAFNSVGESAFSAPSNAVTPRAAPPAAPTLLDVQPAESGAVVSWSAPAETGGAAVTGYQVKVMSSTGAQVGALRPAPVTPTRLRVSGLVDGRSYTFAVAAVTSAGTGAFSAASTPFVVTGRPSLPRNVVATAGTAGAPVTARVGWAAPLTTGGVPIANYEVRALEVRNGAVVRTVVSPRLPASRRSHTMTGADGLRNGSTYRFVVVAVNRAGWRARSTASNRVTAR